MKPQPFAELLQNPARAGTFAIGEDACEIAFRAAAEIGLKVCHIDISRAHDAASLLRLVGHALHFPDWYGENWDALADCLSDLSWCDAAGYVLLLHGSETIRVSDPPAFDMFLDILHEVTAIWREGAVAFWVLIDGPYEDLPRLTVQE